MKRIIACCAIFALAINHSFAEKIDVEKARTLAKEFRTSPSGSSRRIGANISLEVAAQTDNYYAFNYSGKGFVIVANDDAVTNPVIGFSDTGTFNTETMSPGLKGWLEVMSRQIEAVKANPASARGPRKSPENVDRADIEPMLTCKWGQKYPYNKYIEPPHGAEAYAGCVATAMAQIMYYHKWPQSGKGTHSYLLDMDTIVANYDGHIYDWEGMTDTYSNESSERACDAVAKLMCDVGTSVSMIYDYYGAGAYTECVPSAMFNHFGYSGDAKLLYMRHHTIEQWEDSIYSSLANDGPVFYSGASENYGGHAFVCDGYKDGYFHFNFGWEGEDDSYFLLSIGSGFYFPKDVSVVTHIHPAKHEEEHSTDLVATASNSKKIPFVSDSLKLSFTKYASFNEDIEVCISLRDDESGKEFYFEPRGGNQRYLNYAVNYLMFDINELAKHDGYYKLRLMYKEKDGTWAIPLTLSERSEKKLTEGLDSIAVKNGKCFRISDYAPLACVEYSTNYPDTIYITEGDTLRLDVDVTNYGIDAIKTAPRLLLRLNPRIMMKRASLSPSIEVESGGSVTASFAFPMDLPAEYDVYFDCSYTKFDIGVKTVIVTPKNTAPCTLISPVSYEVKNDIIYFDFDLRYNGPSDDKLTLRVIDHLRDMTTFKDRYDYENIGTVHHSCGGSEDYHVRFSRHINAISSSRDCMLYLLCETENGACMVENASYVFNLEDLADEILSQGNHINYATEATTAKYRLVARYKDGKSVSFLLSDKPEVIPSETDMSIMIKTEKSDISIAYDDIRNIVMETIDEGTTSIDAIRSGSDEDVAVTVSDSHNYIVNGVNNAENIRVYAIDGTAVSPSMNQLSDGMIRMNFNSLPNGTYIVTVNSRQTFKIYVK